MDQNRFSQSQMIGCGFNLFDVVNAHVQYHEMFQLYDWWQAQHLPIIPLSTTSSLLGVSEPPSVYAELPPNEASLEHMNHMFDDLPTSPHVESESPKEVVNGRLALNVSQRITSMRNQRITTTSTTTTTKMTNMVIDLDEESSSSSCIGALSEVTLIPALSEASTYGSDNAKMVLAATNPPMFNVGLPILQLRLQTLDSFTPGRQVSATSFAPFGPGQTLFQWADVAGTRYGTLQPGAYAIVKCLGETFFRAIATDPVRLGEACGHITLASQQPVVFAGEICLAADNVVSAWSAVSGTYETPDALARQSGLPLNLYWKFVHADEAALRADEANLHWLKGGHALAPPVTIACDTPRAHSAVKEEKDSPETKRLRSNDANDESGVGSGNEVRSSLLATMPSFPTDGEQPLADTGDAAIDAWDAEVGVGHVNDVRSSLPATLPSFAADGEPPLVNTGDPAIDAWEDPEFADLFNFEYDLQIIPERIPSEATIKEATEEVLSLLDEELEGWEASAPDDMLPALRIVALQVKCSRAWFGMQVLIFWCQKFFSSWAAITFARILLDCMNMQMGLLLVDIPCPSGSLRALS